MCGLYGYITKKDAALTDEDVQARERVLASLAIAMLVRGNEGAGIAACDRKNRYTIAKGALTSSALVKTKEYKDALNGNPYIVMGHTRQATVGEVTSQNAHPFEKGRIIGCHNGCVFNSESIYSEGEVDSEAIFYLLDKYDNDYKKAFKELDGQFAVSWLDKKHPENVYLLRDTNPLFITHCKRLRTIFWCSEDIALHAALIAALGVHEIKSWSTKPDFVYTIATDFSIKKSHVEFYKPDYSSGYSYKREKDSDGFNTNSYHKFHTDNKIESEYCNFCTKKKRGSVRQYALPNGQKDFDEEETYNSLNDEEFEQLKERFKPVLNATDFSSIVSSVENDGCALCQTPINLAEEEGVYFYTSYRCIMCPRCVEELDKKDRQDNITFLTTEEYDKIYDANYSIKDTQFEDI